MLKSMDFPLQIFPTKPTGGGIQVPTFGDLFHIISPKPAIYLLDIENYPIPNILVTADVKHNGRDIYQPTNPIDQSMASNPNLFQPWTPAGNSRSGVADELSFRVRKLDVVCGHVSEAAHIKIMA